jgi:cytochrome P450
MALIPFFARVVQEKRRQPGDDLISALVHEAKQRRLRYSDIVSTAILLLAAGHVTSTHMVGNGVLGLLRTPAVLAAWKGGRYQTAQVLGELLRFDAPVQVTPRTAVADMVVGGRDNRRGQMALGLHGSANRDDRVFPDADTLDPGRRPGHALSFGAGAHFCVGALLARATGAATFATLFECRPNLRLADEPLQWMPTTTQRGLAVLNVLA